MATITMTPNDVHNQALLQNVHPSDWKNPTPTGTYTLVVVGGGTAGLITAAISASLGAKTALIERHFLGGDCLNVGCVPSKGIIRGARLSAELQWARQTGINPDIAESSTAHFPTVMERVRRIRSEISIHDSAQRYHKEFGVDVYMGQGSFTSPRSISVTADDGSIQSLRFVNAVIATGARAAAPPIPGIDTTDYLTNETIFSLTELPKSMAVIGAGPIGCEMAQSFARFGCRVTLFEMAPRVMPREDADAASVIQHALEKAGVTIYTGCAVKEIEAANNDAAVIFSPAGSQEKKRVQAERLLVAIGRAPNIEKLHLEAAQVQHHARGITVNSYMQTSNRRIYAAGDIASPYQFTHMAEAVAGIVVQNALFMRTKKVESLVVPWCTYTSPEVAHVGLSEQEAKKRNIPVVIYRHDMHAVDRAHLDDETEGFVKLVVCKSHSYVLGATIVAAHAGEMIPEIILAIQQKMKISALSAVIHPYPTQAEAVKRAATQYLRQKLTEKKKRILSFWFRMRTR